MQLETFLRGGSKLAESLVEIALSVNYTTPLLILAVLLFCRVLGLTVCDNDPHLMRDIMRDIRRWLG